MGFHPRVVDYVAQGRRLSQGLGFVGVPVQGDFLPQHICARAVRPLGRARCGAGAGCCNKTPISLLTASALSEFPSYRVVDDFAQGRRLSQGLGFVGVPV